MPDCNSCEKSRTPASIPYFVHESEMYRAERLNGRLVALCVLLLCTLILSNLFWMAREFDVIEGRMQAIADNVDAAG